MTERIPISAKGYDRLREELKKLKSEERPRIIKEIEEARAHGDLSENAEYHAAKERQSHLETRIQVLEDRISRAQVIDTRGQTPDAVRFGATVLLVDIETAESVSYTLVGEDESDATNGLISVRSPIGRALLGKAVADVVTVRVPRGTREFEVRRIHFEEIF